MRPSFFHHLHPPTIPARQSRFRYTLGAGGYAVFLTLVLLVSGALLMFYYVPTPAEAGPSIQMITFLVPYGALVRNLHYWSAQILVVVAAIHLLRVVFTGAYRSPRRFNYLLGLTLFVLVLFLNFTGYVLRWDEGIRWALVAGTNLVHSIPGIGPDLYRLVMGASQPGPAALTRFYTWHIFGLVIIFLGIGVWHIFRVRRDGGIAVPPPVQRVAPERISRFDLVRREGVAALIGMAILLLVAAFIPAPLAAPMSEVTSQAADSKAPWFFLWVQQLLKSGDAFWMGVFIPLLVLAILGAIPYVLPAVYPDELGRWFPPSGRIAQGLTLVLVILVVALTILAALAPPA